MVAQGSQSLWGLAGAIPWPGPRSVRSVWVLGCAVGTHRTSGLPTWGLIPAPPRGQRGRIVSSVTSLLTARRSCPSSEPQLGGLYTGANRAHSVHAESRS